MKTDDNQITGHDCTVFLFHYKIRHQSSKKKLDKIIQTDGIVLLDDEECQDKNMFHILHVV